MAEVTGNSDWKNLPQAIIVSIYRNIFNLSDVFKAASTCRNWYECFFSSQLWRHMYFYVSDAQRDAKQSKCVETFGSKFRSVQISLDQECADNRLLAIRLIDMIATTPNRQLETFVLRFIGTNPLFYAGKEFLDSIGRLVGPIPSDVKPTRVLKTVDLSGAQIKIDDALVDLIASNNPNLVHLNLQNSQLVCLVSAVSLIKLIRMCPHLEGLSIFNSSVTEEVLMELATKERESLQHISLLCSAQDKYVWDEIRGEYWFAVAKKAPNLRVTLKFDHRCPTSRINDLMVAEIPVYSIEFEVTSCIYDQIICAARTYSNTLEHVVILTPPFERLQDAVLIMSKECPNLQSLDINYQLRPEIIDHLINNHPGMRRLK